MRFALVTAITLSVVLTACAEFPALEGTVLPEQDDATYPTLVPLSPILAQSRGENRGSETIEPVLNPRIAALRARAATLRPPVIAAAERERMMSSVQ